jgi:cell division protein FtsB
MPHPGRLLAMPLRWLRGWWPLLVASAVLAYFGYHAVHGQRGFLAWIDRNREIEAMRQELAAVQGQRAALERRVAGFRPGQLDRDLLEEELRQLGYIKKNEVIVLTPEGKPAEAR